MDEYQRPQNQQCAPPPPPQECPPPKPPEPTPQERYCYCRPEPDETTAPEPIVSPECKESSKCPPRPTKNSNCLDDLIEAQTKEIAKAETAKAFKTDLTQLLQKAKAAQQEYTVAKYEELLKLWNDQTTEILKRITKIKCHVPTWCELIECRICPLFYDIINAQRKLGGDGTLYRTTKSLYDVQYWLQRNGEAKQARFDAVKAVLAAWEKPAQTIEKVLTDNAKLITTTTWDKAEHVFDLFLRVIPAHIAIAPPDKRKVFPDAYTRFCECDKGKPEVVKCGGVEIDIGLQSLRSELDGPQPTWIPQPFLVEPDKYFEIVCCLAGHYQTAKNALGDALGELEKTDAQIKRMSAEITDRKKSFEKDARAALGRAIEAMPCPPCPPAQDPAECRPIDQ